MQGLFEIPAGETCEGTTEVAANAVSTPEKQAVSEPGTLLLDPCMVRKINLLTSKERPNCAYCDAKVGFSWY